MKVLVIYSSKTGFTKRYAERIADDTNAMLLPVKEAKSKSDDFFNEYDAIIYGGWIMAGRVDGADWFFEKAKKLNNKKLVLFACGATPAEHKDIQEKTNAFVADDVKDIVKPFYCPGGIDYDKMGFLSKCIMKAMAKSLINNKDNSEEERKAGELIINSFDAVDMKYAENIVSYVLN